MKGLVITGGMLGAAILGLGFWWMAQGSDVGSDGLPLEVAVPELRGPAKRGAELFAESCATCHGENAAGSGQGPPLVHRIYEPGHHADFSFYRAVRQGVRAHHWNFGDMPAVAGVSDAEIDRIVAYVRALQRANGIGG